MRLWTCARAWVLAQITAAAEKSQSIVHRPRKRGRKAEKCAQDTSLNQSIGEDGSEIVDLCYDDYSDYEPQCFEDGAALANAVEKLAPRARAIFEARWLSDEPTPLSQLATQFQISAERCRQIGDASFKTVSDLIAKFKPRPGSSPGLRAYVFDAFSGRGQKLSQSTFRNPNFRDRSPASNRERLR